MKPALEGTVALVTGASSGIGTATAAALAEHGAALPHLLRAAGGGPRHVADMVNVSSVAGRVARNGNCWPTSRAGSRRSPR